MIEQIKGTMEYAKLSIESFGAEVLLTPELIRQVLNLITEVERLKAIEEHAIKRIKAETAGNLRLSNQVAELLKALEWYANEEIYKIRENNDDPFDIKPELVVVDGGKRARQALKGSESP